MISRITNIYSKILLYPIIGSAAKKVAPLVKKILTLKKENNDLLSSEIISSLAWMRTKCDRMQKEIENQQNEINELKKKLGKK